MTHLGQRLSALIDGELDGDDRDRVLGHLARCGWCRDEAAALRALKRRMNALGEAAAGSALTGRLMGLSAQSDDDIWPQPAGAGFPFAAHSRPESRASRYFLAGSVAVFLAGLGTAAFIAGGEPQAQAPAPKVTPSVDVLLLEHADVNGLHLNGLVQPRTGESDNGRNHTSSLP
ncbi:MAG TPA: zf-HC2 domain-containing protein [Streptosporangiaceae bacterium]|nr:zf-HC2 domain-containing protein [Streptosporangiaceae bacterium]